MKFGLSDDAIAMIVQVFRNHVEVDLVKVFGSRSMGTDRPNSDIDLAIWGDLSEQSIGRIQLELDELPLPYSFDVEVYDAIKHPPVKEHIETHGRVLFQRQ